MIPLEPDGKAAHKRPKINIEWNLINKKFVEITQVCDF